LVFFPLLLFFDGLVETSSLSSSLSSSLVVVDVVEVVEVDEVDEKEEVVGASGRMAGSEGCSVGRSVGNMLGLDVVADDCAMVAGSV
jgi:hypothetical protein